MGCDGNLYEVDPDTGDRVVVNTLSPTMGGMAFDPTTGTLYTVPANAGPGTDNLYTIALPSGTATLVGSLGVGAEIGDIVFDGSGNLFGVVGGSTTNDLVSINKVTGQFVTGTQQTKSAATDLDQVAETLTNSVAAYKT